MIPRIAQVVIGLPVEGPFDYSVSKEQSDQIKKGQRVGVSFSHQKKIGYVVGFVEKSKFKELKPVSSLIDHFPILDESILKLSAILSTYYACSLGEAIESALPQLLREGRAVDLVDGVVKNILPDEKKVKTILIHDLSAAENRPQYLEQIKTAIAADEGVLFIVPEVSYILKVSDKIKKSIGLDAAVLDSRLTPKAELVEWLAIKNGQKKIVVGTRSAIFAPVQNLGLIIVQDEESPSYKQEQSPFYHVREVALMRRDIEHCDLIFYCQDAPSAELWQEVRKEHMEYSFVAPQRIAGLQFVDLTNYQPGKTGIISFPLRNAMERTLSQKGRVVLLMNRLGFSLLTRCQKCGHTLKCPRCNVTLMYSYSKKKLLCRQCNFTQVLSERCPTCRTVLQSVGMGIEKLESEVSRLFPQARVERYDKESKEIPKNFNILIATQAFLRVQERVKPELVGILRVDADLNRNDFRSAQKVFSRLIRLRRLTLEKVIVQTGIMDNYALKAASKLDFNEFYKNELNLRKEMGLPPTLHLVAIVLRGPSESAALAQTVQLFSQLEKFPHKEIDIMEPQADFIPKLRDQYRFMIMLRGKSVKTILTLIKKGIKDLKRKKDVILTVNVDP